jgi:hypothetical protein
MTSPDDHELMQQVCNAGQPESLKPLAAELLEPDWSIVQATVYPLFGRTYTADGKYEPTWRERVFGRRHRD